MMAPKYERARMLGAAIDAAMYELEDPIDRIEVVGDKVLVRAGRRKLTMTYGYRDSYSEDGQPLLGGGQWVVEIKGGGR